MQETNSEQLFISTSTHSLQKKFPELYRAVVTAIRVKGYAIRTEQTYLQWWSAIFGIP